MIYKSLLNRHLLFKKNDSENNNNYINNIFTKNEMLQIYINYCLDDKLINFIKFSCH